MTNGTAVRTRTVNWWKFALHGAVFYTLYFAALALPLLSQESQPVILLMLMILMFVSFAYGMATQGDTMAIGFASITGFSYMWLMDMIFAVKPFHWLFLTSAAFCHVLLVWMLVEASRK